MLIQYEREDKSWSDWMPFEVNDGHFIVDGQVLAKQTVRVLKDENPQNSDVAWYL